MYNNRVMRITQPKFLQYCGQSLMCVNFFFLNSAVFEIKLYCSIESRFFEVYSLISAAVCAGKLNNAR